MKKIFISLFFIFLFVIVYIQWTFSVYDGKIIIDDSFDNSLVKSQLRSAKALDKKQLICTVRELDYCDNKLNKPVYNKISFEPGRIDKENHTLEVIKEY
ncbi:hypothetical protein [Chryseobacterium sp. GVT01B]|uniref:hypothetical protein n=1 Tax=Chryseobacterium sp. GVT01B TaxID=2862675 RepID=UPI001CC014CB|nr:hypothetical protein [Chryseobacterium sp. GVT01B]